MNSDEPAIRKLDLIDLVPPPTEAGNFKRAIQILARQWKVLLIVFVAVVSGAVLAGLSMVPEFQAELKVLVLHNREEPSVSAGTGNMVQPAAISEEELNSEVEIFKSRDLLQAAVVACGLDRLNEPGLQDRIKRVLGIKILPPSPEQAIDTAANKLDHSLKVTAMKKTNLIEASYTSRYPELSVKVLNTLADLYLLKHVKVHRIAGALPFFTQETKRYGNELEASTLQLSNFTRKSEVGSAEAERDRTAEKLVAFEADMRQAQADARDRDQRILTIEAELKATPERLQTQVRQTGNATLLQQLKVSLHDRELKRSEMAVTFSPNYAPLRQLDAEIAQSRKAIEAEQSAPVREETSDAAPTHTFLVEELAKTRADLASRRAQATALAEVVRDYRNKVAALEQSTIQESSLNRNVKLAETNYLLYRSKLEDSRISDALDRDNIVNVSIAEPPIKPQHPSSLSFALIVGIGIILGSCASLGSAYMIDGMASTFRTSEEVEQLLGIPLLAAVPEPKGFGAAGGSWSRLDSV